MISVDNSIIYFRKFEIQLLETIPINKFFEEELRPTFNLNKDTNEYLLFTFQPQEINEQTLIILHLRDYQLVAIFEKVEYSDVNIESNDSDIIFFITRIDVSSTTILSFAHEKS